MVYTKFGVRPVSPALGAEIDGLDLSQPLDPATVAELRQARLEYLVLFFRNQTLSPAQQLAFARQFGELDIYPMVEGLAAYPELVEVRKEADETVNFGGLWHSDTSYLPEPPSGAVLYATEIPPVGGDTLFANMYLAYDALSDGMKRMLAGLIGVNSAEAKGGAQSRSVRREEAPKDDQRVAQLAEHPIIRTIPETGGKVLYANGGHTVRFKDFTDEESAPILDMIYRQQTRPEFACRFRWEVGSVAFWDNRTTQHNAINDYHGHRRIVYRCALKGERPI